MRPLHRPGRGNCDGSDARLRRPIGITTGAIVHHDGVYPEHVRSISGFATSAGGG
jgi:hypothetical protein